MARIDIVSLPAFVLCFGAEDDARSVETSIHWLGFQSLLQAG
jgi:hypothetical protein